MERTIPDAFFTIYDYATNRYKFVILVGWSGGDKADDGSSLCKQSDMGNKQTRGNVLRIRRAADKETTWMLMRDKPTRYHSDNDTNTNTARKSFTLYSNSARACLPRA
jgi:hypothetical protein